jgi:hypothetical protein
MRSKLLPESKSSTTVVLSGSVVVCSAVLDVKKNKSKCSTKVYEKAVFRIQIQLGLWIRIKAHKRVQYNGKIIKISCLKSSLEG